MHLSITDGAKHICLPDPDSLLVHLAKQKFKQLASIHTVTTRDAYQTVLQELQRHHPNIAPQFGPYSSLSSLGYRLKQKLIPPIPNHPVNILIPDEYAKTTEGKQFLLYFGVQGDPPRQHEHDRRLVITLFSTQDLVTRCIRAKRVCFVGTEKPCLYPFNHSCTIHAHVGNVCLPLIHVWNLIINCLDKVFYSALCRRNQERYTNFS